MSVGKPPQVPDRPALLIERLPLAYLLCDANLRVLDWNRAAERVFGYTKAEALGRPAMDLILPLPVSDQIWELIRRLRAGDMEVTSIAENRTKDGRLITCAWFNTPLMDPDGRFAGLISLAQDVTDRKQPDEKPTEMDVGAAQSTPLVLGKLLSMRERQVFAMLVEGHTNREIAARLQRSVKTVEAHRARIARKLGLKTRADLTRYALDAGILERGTAADSSPDDGSRRVGE